MTVDLDRQNWRVIKLATLRAYAVGAAFSSRDADGTDDFAWRPTDRYWTDVTYRRPRPRRTRPHATSAVGRRIDPTRIRTLDQQKAVARAL